MKSDLFVKRFSSNWAIDILLRVFVSLAISALIAALLIVIFNYGSINNNDDHLRGDKWGFAITSILLAPVIENSLLISFIRLSTLFVKTVALNVILGAAILSSIHSAISMPWGIVVFFPFVVLGATYCSYAVEGRSKAFWLSCLVHGLHNAFMLLAISTL